MNAAAVLERGLSSTGGEVLAAGGCRRLGSLYLHALSGGAATAVTIEAAPGLGDVLHVRRGSGWRRMAAGAAVLQAGALFVIDPGQPYQLDFESSFEAHLLRLPAQSVHELVGDCSVLQDQAIPACCGPAAIYDSLVARVLLEHERLAAADLKSCADALLALLGSVLRTHARRQLDEVSVAERYHRERVQEFARAHLGSPELDVRMIAAAVGLSTSYIHRLFANSGQTLMQWVNGERLDACHRELSSPCELKRPVYAVAQDWGFNNQAHFSRAFRARFGVSPSAVRQNGQTCGCDSV